MKICLRYLADPGFQKGIGEELGVEQSTVSRTVKYVVQKIIEQTANWIQFPASNQKNCGKANIGFPLQLVDCTHVEIEKPKNHGDEYINRKGKPTINVQATCDAREIFTSVEVSWPGSVHDSRIWKNSEIRQIMMRSTNTVLMGDDGYGIEPWLMTPFPNPNDNTKKRYNKIFKKERVIIERCFGQVKRRFPILKYVCRVKLENISNIIIACFVLHNIAKMLGDADFEEDEELEEENEDPPELRNFEDENIRIRGQEVRQNLAELIYNNDY
ncbi:Putative nuclease HARBI1-like Protein [Tribolium castaneum]|uniref:Nuclease HARBI1-like Protein n=1 Tax=Tribolium castaneum TaxID=7070 RepID=D2A2Q7_TRICA|nr:Putative nuclease HARBI1-like Protein [Tribolium castaneum]